MVGSLRYLVFAGVLLCCGCPAREEKPVVKEDEPPKKAAPVRRMDMSEARDIMNKLRHARLKYFEEHMTPPEKWQDLSFFYDNIERIDLVLRDEWITYVWGVDQLKLAENPKAILAYETDAGPEGKRVVLLADGTIVDWDAATFEKAPKLTAK